MRPTAPSYHEELCKAIAISCWMAAKVIGWCFRCLTLEAFYQHKTTRSKNDITSFERGYGMIHNDEDGDNDANDGDDDEREISWK
ncbi:hypothetical protein Tco_1524992 [Tanacetum coccineum]